MDSQLQNLFLRISTKEKNEREKILTEISTNEKTTIIFESPHRFYKLLNELKEYCGGQREISVSRELTKKFEEQLIISSTILSIFSKIEK